jgi:hypothetical protein
MVSAQSVASVISGTSSSAMWGTLGRRVRGPYRHFAHDMLNREASRLAQISNRSKLRSPLSERIEARQNHERIL